MPNKSAHLALFMLCLAASSVQAHDDEDTNTKMYELFWTIFWLSVLGFLIYLLCTYPVWDWTLPNNNRHACDTPEPVINVRIINTLPLHNG